MWCTIEGDLKPPAQKSANDSPLDIKESLVRVIPMNPLLEAYQALTKLIMRLNFQQISLKSSFNKINFRMLKLE